MRPRRARQARTAAALVVPLVAATLAVLHPGTPEQQVDLHDGAVWLTNTSKRMLGRYNAQVEELNSALVAEGAEFDVLQDGADVVLLEPGSVAVVDPAAVTLAGQAAVPSSAQVSMAAGVVAVTEPGSGDVWVRRTADLGTLQTDADGDLDAGPRGAAVVTRSGTVLAVRADGGVLQGVVGEDGGLTVVEVAGLGGGSSSAVEQVTAVGETPVALTGSTLRTPAGSVTVPGDAPVLQQPGPAADAVLVATTTALVEVPLDGREPVVHETGGTGRPAAPVRVGACGLGAWATASGSYLELCDGAAPEVDDLGGLTTSDRLVFRVNRDVVVLNDTLRGRLWLPLQDTRMREPDWTLVEPQEKSEDDQSDAEERERTQDLEAQCTPESAAPEAVDDEFGVRPGQTVLLPVIDNDASSECGILAVSTFDELDEDFGTLTSVHGGRVLQLEVAPRARGRTDTTYTITDGRGSTAPSTATIRLVVRAEGENGPPDQVRNGAFQVEQGASATYDVLSDFRDPDGDPLVLVGAAAEGGGAVTTRQDGQLTFTATGGDLGRQRLTVQVSDGRETTEGTVFADVRPGGSLPPVIDPVLAVTYVDQAVEVHPLDSVRSVSREPVRLAEVQQLPGATVTPDLAAGTFTFQAATPGTYYVTFVVTATPQQATGLARIDVRERPEEPQPPVATLDVALLPPGGEVTIDPLGNDEDPGGGVLVLQSVDVPRSSGLDVAVLTHDLLRISSTRVLDEVVPVRYTVSNGYASTVGTVLVQPIRSTGTGQPPVVPPVEASVRTGGVVTVDVLGTAYDPDGDDLTLLPDLAEPLGDGQGLLFVSEGVLRYQAPQRAMRVTATVQVQDSTGQRTAGFVTIDVHGSDPETKAPPRPKALTARVFEGQKVRIDVPLTGIDPDGDGVLLLGQASAASKGNVIGVGPDWLEYQAVPGELGTDTFEYAVEDWVGQRAVGRIRVGIAPRPSGAAQVIARDDEVTVRPGQSIEVRVLANDVDSAGGELTLDPRLDVPEGVDAEIEARRVVVRTPDEEGVVQIAYVARNDRGGRAAAVLTVHVTDDAPILPPIAQDIVVPARETVNRTSVEVDVLAQAENPSGPLSDLEVSVHPSAAEVASVTADQSIVVQLVDRPQTLPYRLTNTNPLAQQRSTYAFITVPAIGDFPPILRPRAPALEVVSGEELVIPLAEQVQVAPGRDARIDGTDTVTATKSDGSRLWKDDRTLRFVSEPGYAGAASITFAVTDATGASVSRSTVLTLPVTVLAAEDNPPTFTPSVLEMGPGESTSVDLTAFTSAPVSSTTRYTYSLTTPSPPGFSAALEGSVLTVRAERTTPRGTAAGVGVAIGYGAGTRVRGQVDFLVTASKEPLARLVDQTRTAAQGQTVSVPVLEGAYNPFPGTSMTLLGAVVETPGAGTAEISGQSLLVRPDDDFVGRMVTRFRVRDVTGDPDREVEGRLTVVVQGRPAAPSAPRVVEVRDRTVVLAWDAPPDNGAPITGYVVTAQPGGRSTTCASTTCTVEGLTNDVEYRFTVVARNAVGTSPASPASAPARPDARPGAPAAPTLVRGDGEVTASWRAPENPGSPIVRYELEITPAPAGGATATTTSTSYRFTGLTNGTSYTVRVRAVNDAPEPGDWSPSSAAAKPARAPDAPRTVTFKGGEVTSRTITVSWEAPAFDGGESVLEYRLTVDDGTVVTVGGTARSATFQGRLGQRYTVTVAARNVIGWSPATSKTDEIYGAPTPVRNLTATDASESGTAFGRGELRVSWSPPESSGLDDAGIRDYVVQVDGTTRRTVVDAGQSSFATTITSLDGGPHDVRVVARNRYDLTSEATTSGTVTTVPQAVTLQDPVQTEDGDVVLTWSPGASGGTEITGYRWVVTRDGEPDLAGDGSGTSVTVPVTQEPWQDVAITVWAVNAQGESASARVSGRFRPPAPPEDPPEGEDP